MAMGLGSFQKFGTEVSKISISFSITDTCLRNVPGILPDKCLFTQSSQRVLRRTVKATPAFPWALTLYKTAPTSHLPGPNPQDVPSTLTAVLASDSSPVSPCWDKSLNALHCHCQAAKIFTSGVLSQTALMEVEDLLAASAAEGTRCTSQWVGQSSGGLSMWLTGCFSKQSASFFYST